MLSFLRITTYQFFLRLLPLLLFTFSFFQKNIFQEDICLFGPQNTNAPITRVCTAYSPTKYHAKIYGPVSNMRSLFHGRVSSHHRVHKVVFSRDLGRQQSVFNFGVSIRVAVPLRCYILNTNPRHLRKANISRFLKFSVQTVRWVRFGWLAALPHDRDGFR